MLHNLPSLSPPVALRLGGNASRERRRRSHWCCLHAVPCPAIAPPHHSATSLPPPPQWSWPFNAPVDLRQYPDYLTLVASPMDFGTIKRRIEAGCASGGAGGGGYRHPDEFLADVRLVFDNARLYNKPGSDVHVMANTLQVCVRAWQGLRIRLQCCCSSPTALRLPPPRCAQRRPVAWRMRWCQNCPAV